MMNFSDIFKIFSGWFCVSNKVSDNYDTRPFRESFSYDSLSQFICLKKCFNPEFQAQITEIYIAGLARRLKTLAGFTTSNCSISSSLNPLSASSEIRKSKISV
jgi:hypothetical protein